MGDLFKQQTTKDGVKTRSRKWYANYKDEDGRAKRVALSADKQAARTMLADLERQVERRKSGIIDKVAVAGLSPIQEALDKYYKHQQLKGDDPGYIKEMQSYIDKIATSCDFDSLAKLDPDKLDDFLARMVRPDGLPASARTKIKYRQAMMGFANWCVKGRKLAYNPLQPSTRPEGDTKVKRRALPLDQLKTLLDVALVRPLHDKLMVRSGPNKGKMVARISQATREKMMRQGRLRVLLYRTAFYTGLRRNELRQMRVCHLDFGPSPKASLPASITKNKEDAYLPLRPELADDLRAWIESEGLSPLDRVFPVGRDVAKHLRRDMARAGIPWFDARGRVFDFHSLRKCTGTYMNKSGVPITTAKEMLRHSTVELTAGVYNDGDLHDLRGAIEKLPNL